MRLETTFNSLHVYPMTVVMATLGGDTLKRTIEQLIDGSVVPAEILICIPDRESMALPNLKFSNVRVIRTKCRGQVAQRAIGFKNASYEIVMHLDDDIVADKNCIAYLIETLHKYGTKVAVAPVLRECSANEGFKKNNILLKIFYFLVNGRDGYQTGAISKAGMEIGYDRLMIKEGVHDVEWLPGGCVIHFRKNLIKKNFFPYEGKAYCEDLLHSYKLKKSGIRLKLDTRAHCSIKSSSYTTYRIKEYIESMSADYKARKYYVRLSSKSYFRMNLYYLCSTCNYIIKKLTAKITK